MSDKEYSRLAFLMDSFGITGQQLADLLHVNKTLISKWRNHKRQIPTRSEYLKIIAEFFVAMDAHNNFGLIKKILAGYDCNFDSREYLTKFIGQWLSEIDEQQEKLINIFNSNSFSGGFELYQGNDGKRKAVLKFFDQVLALPEGQKLLLISQEDQAWLTDDSLFLKTWKRKMSEILEKNNHITIVHTVDRGFRELAPILTQWLPLHMTGKVASYYHPKYQDSTMKYTLFILKDRLAVTGITATGFTRNIYTHFYSHPAVIKECEWMFQSLLSQCHSLFDNFTRTPLSKLHVIMYAAEQKQENSYLLACAPFLTTMPKDLLLSVLEENAVEGDGAEKYLDFHERAQVFLDKNLQQSHVRHVYDLDMLLNTVANGIIYQGGLIPVVGHQLRVSASHFRRHLVHLTYLLDIYPNFEIALVSNNLGPDFKGIYMRARESSVFYAGNIINNNGPYHPVLTAEPTIVNAFYQYQDNIWHTVPRIYRSKEWVKNKLIQIANNKTL